MKILFGLWILVVFFYAPGAFAIARLEFWHSMGGEKGKLIQEIVSDFNSLPENRGKVEITTQYVGSYDEGLNKLRTALLGGEGPSIVQITDIGQRVMIDSQSIVPLQDFIDRDPSFPLAEILPQVRRYYEVGGRLYSLPFATSNPILYYNADAFTKAGITSPPRTFEELRATARKLTDSRTRTYGLSWPLNSWFFEEFLARQGVDLVEPSNGRGARPTIANYLSPEAVGFVSLWSEMIREGSFANVGRGWDPAEQNFLAGRVNMLITSTSDILEILGEAKFRIATAPIPGPLGRGGTIVGGNSLWILGGKPPEEQQAAYRFVKFMASPSVQERWHKRTGYFPIRKDVIQTLKSQGFYDRYPVAWTAIQQLLSSPEGTPTQGALMGVFPEVREQITTAIEEVLSGEADAPTALRKAKEQTEFSLKRYHGGGGF